jgi:hypothetical protein
MPICALCRKREADKKGSHLVPHFLMKRVDNADNKIGRDQELGFELGMGKVKGYFGRNVQPDKLEGVFGELSDKDIACARSSMIVDDLLCGTCETRLAKLEGAYSGSMNNKGTGNYQSFADGLLATLFWISIYWRMSASGRAFKMEEIDEQHLRIILNGGLDAGDPSAYLLKLGKELTSISYRLLRDADYSSRNSGFIYFQQDRKRPYSAMIGEHAVFLDIDNSRAEAADPEFFGLSQSRDEAQVNSAAGPEFTMAIGDELYNMAAASVVQFYMEDFKQNLDRKLNRLHDHFIGKGAMAPVIKQKILLEITEAELPLGRMYTDESITAAATKILVRHEPYKSVFTRMHTA